MNPGNRKGNGLVYAPGCGGGGYEEELYLNKENSFWAGDNTDININ